MHHGAMLANSLGLESWISYYQVFWLNVTWHELPVFTEENSLNLCREIPVVIVGYSVYFAYDRKWTSDLSYSWTAVYITSLFEKVCTEQFSRVYT